MNDPMSPTSPKVERSDNLIILTFTAHAIRDVESVIARELDTLDTLAAGTGFRHLLLDFTHVENLNGTELSTLIALHKRVETAGGRLTLFNLSARVFELFSITRLNTLFEICREPRSLAPALLGATDGPHRPET